MPGVDRDDLALLAQAAQDAGEVARGFFEGAARSWDKPGGAGPVTEADLAVNELLDDRLRGARPGYGWLSEESEDGAARLDRQSAFIVDPIDGTRAFIEGSPTWAISLAVARAGTVTAAVVHLPMRDKTYGARVGGGATLNGAALCASRRASLDGAEVLAGKGVFDPWHWRDAQVPPVRRAFRSSIAYRLCLVAEGRFDAMLTLHAAWEWDVAAGALIVAEAGGLVSDRRGGALVFNTPAAQVNGVLAAGAGLHAPIMDRLAQA